VHKKGRKDEDDAIDALASVRLLVYVILAKYLEHMPLHRLEQSFKTRCGVAISRKTMGG